MTVALLVIPVLIFALFQGAKRLFPWLEGVTPIGKQLLVVTFCLGASLLYVRLGLPLPDEVRSLQSAAIVGLINGLAALGVHGIKKAGEG